MSESRVALRCNGFTIAEHESGEVSVDRITGPEQVECRDFHWKIEMHKQKQKKPRLVRIRGDHHPQRVLTGIGTLDWSSYDLFEVEYSNADSLTPFHLKQGGRYMYLENGNIKWSASTPPLENMWDFVPCGSAFSMWQVTVLGVGVPVAAAGAVVGGAVVGVGAMGACIFAIVSGVGDMAGALWMVGIIAGVAAGAGIARAEARALYNEFTASPENIALFVVDKR